MVQYMGPVGMLWFWDPVSDNESTVINDFMS